MPVKQPSRDGLARAVTIPISYLNMCQTEGASLQQGMNFRLRGRTSVILMSVQPGAPYADRVEEGGRVLVYEGHNQPRMKGGVEPSTLDQVLETPALTPTQNGRFFEAARHHRDAHVAAERVRVYEKVRAGIWVYNGTFHLVDAWAKHINERRVFKFRLDVTDDEPQGSDTTRLPLDQNRVIPTEVKLSVWKRDRGQCVQCGATDNLHFDHVIPYSRGGSSLVAENVQLLCARHNLEKSDRIQ